VFDFTCMGVAQMACLNLASYVAIRTKFLDQEVLRCIDQGVTQFVIPATGGDARAYRLCDHVKQPLQFYHLDLPDVMAHRQKVFADLSASTQTKHVTIHDISTDLSVDGSWQQALLGSGNHHCALIIVVDSLMLDLLCPSGRTGFDPRQPSCWVAEGLFMYLTNDQVDACLSAIRKLCVKGSVLCGDFLNEYQLTSNMTKTLREIWSAVCASQPSFS